MSLLLVHKNLTIAILWSGVHKCDTENNVTFLERNFKILPNKFSYQLRKKRSFYYIQYLPRRQNILIILRNYNFKKPNLNV